LKKILRVVPLGFLLSSCTAMDVVNVGAGIYDGIEKEQ